MRVATVAMLLLGSVAAGCTSGDGGDVIARLVVTGADGSVTIVSDEGEAIESVAPASGVGGSVQPTPSFDGSSVVWTSGDRVNVWRDGEVTEIDAEFSPFFYLWNPTSDRLLALGNDPTQPAVRAVVIDPFERQVDVVEVDRPIYGVWLDSERLVLHVGRRHLTIEGGGENRIIAGGSARFLAPDVAGGDVIAVQGTEGTLTASAVEIQVQTRTGSITRFDPETNESVPMLDVTGEVAFAVSGDESQLAILEGTRRAGALIGSLSVFDLESGTFDEVADDVAMFEWGPAGSLLVTTAMGGGRFAPHVWSDGSLTSFDSYEPTLNLLVEYLPFWDQYARARTSWSPDEGAFAYAAVVDGEPTVLVQKTDGSDPTEVSDGVFVSWMASPTS